MPPGLCLFLGTELRQYPVLSNLEAVISLVSSQNSDCKGHTLKVSYYPTRTLLAIWLGAVDPEGASKKDLQYYHQTFTLVQFRKSNEDYK